MGPFKRYLLFKYGVILDINVKSEGGTGYTHTPNKNIQGFPWIYPQVTVTSVTIEGLGRLGFPTVDGSEIWEKTTWDVENPLNLNDKKNYLSTGSGFLLSTVLQM